MGTESSPRPLESWSLLFLRSRCGKSLLPSSLSLLSPEFGGEIGVLLVAWPKVNKNVNVRGREGQEVATGRRG